MLSDGMPTLADTTVLDAFRRWGYLEAQLDPLHEVTGRLTPQRHPDLAADGPEAEAARRIYLRLTQGT
jgi:2-oxoglutarate dehydrogenase E1 component